MTFSMSFSVFFIYRSRVWTCNQCSCIPIQQWICVEIQHWYCKHRWTGFYISRRLSSHCHMFSGLAVSSLGNIDSFSAPIICNIERIYLGIQSSASFSSGHLRECAKLVKVVKPPRQSLSKERKFIVLLSENYLAFSVWIIFAWQKFITWVLSRNSSLELSYGPHVDPNIEQNIYRGNRTPAEGQGAQRPRFRLDHFFKKTESTEKNCLNQKWKLICDEVRARRGEFVRVPRDTVRPWT